MASNKKFRDVSLEEKRLQLATKYVASLLTLLEQLLAEKNTDRQ